MGNTMVRKNQLLTKRRRQEQSRLWEVVHFFSKKGGYYWVQNIGKALVKGLEEPKLYMVVSEAVFLEVSLPDLQNNSVAF